MSWNPIYGFLILTSTVISYVCGLGVGRFSHNRNIQKSIIFGCLVVNLSILVFYKYFNFLHAIFQDALSSVGVSYIASPMDVLLPVGISFYTFEVISYIIDVYRGTIPAEKNFFRYSLFIAFFPKLVAGPIERPTNLLPQIHKEHKFNYDNFQSGMMLILWGLFQKIIIADRLAILVNQVFNNVESYRGFEFIIATIFFSFQIFCDFSAYSDIAIGASRILGLNLLKNFERPYFSKNVREFWRRWHISLSTWFKDYLFIPLGGSRNGKFVSYRNILIVFLVSGLWHGANWTFIVWGLLHGIFQVLSLISHPYAEALLDRLKIKRDSFSLNLFNVCTTFALISFAWIFFRANSLQDALYIVKRLFVYNPESLFTDRLYTLGLNEIEFKLGVYSILLLVVVHFIQRNNSISLFLKNQWLPVRWFIYLSAISIILIFGIYGSQYDASQFIYFQF